MQQNPYTAHIDEFPLHSIDVIQIVMVDKCSGSSQRQQCIMCILPGKALRRRNAREGLATKRISLRAHKLPNAVNLMHKGLTDPSKILRMQLPRHGANCKPPLKYQCYAPKNVVNNAAFCMRRPCLDASFCQTNSSWRYTRPTTYVTWVN